MSLVRKSSAGIALATVALACAETSPGVPPCVMPDAGCTMVTVDIDAAPTPANHRPSGSTCPTARGPGALLAACSYDAGPPLPCLHDSDCTTGKSGRCLPAPPVNCNTACSYDECTSDSDCGQAPCLCRGSATDATANVCLTGSNCQVDSNCGAGGYCSPSGVGTSCSTSYFCHTASDRCNDSSDCADGLGCNYDPNRGAWACSLACAQPP